MNLLLDVNESASCLNTSEKVDAVSVVNGSPSIQASSSEGSTQFLGPLKEKSLSSSAVIEGDSISQFQKSIRDFYQTSGIAEYTVENSKILMLDARLPLHIAIRSLFEYNKPFATVYDEQEGDFVGFIDASEVIDFFCHLNLFLNCTNPVQFLQTLPPLLLTSPAASIPSYSTNSLISDPNGSNNEANLHAQTLISNNSLSGSSAASSVGTKSASISRTSSTKNFASSVISSSTTLPAVTTGDIPIIEDISILTKSSDKNVVTSSNVEYDYENLQDLSVNTINCSTIPPNIQPPWSYTIDRWRYINKYSRPFTYVNVERNALDAMKSLLENDVSYSIIWNDDRSAPLSFVTLPCLVGHLIQNLRGNSVQFDQLVRAELKIGTYEGLVTVSSTTPFYKVLSLFREKNLSVIPIVNVSTGSYIGCFTKNHFMQLILKSLTDETAIDPDLAILTLLEKLNQSPVSSANISGVNNGGFSIYSCPVQTSAPNAAPKRTTNSTTSTTSATTTSSTATSTSPSAMQISHDSSSNLTTVVPAMNPGNTTSSITNTALASSASSALNSSSQSSSQLYNAAVTEDDMLLREAIIRALLSEEHRIYFLDRKNFELQGVLTLADICKFLVGWGCSNFDSRNQASQRGSSNTASQTDAHTESPSESPSAATNSL